MKSVLLTALLLAAPAAGAQGVSAIPARPATSAAPTTPAAAVAATLTLSAPVGTSAEFVTSTQTRFTLEDVTATGADGQPVSAAELAALRRQLGEGLGAAGTQNVSGKAFYRVQGRGADGTVTLLTTSVTPVPGRGDVTVRLVQTVAPGGQTRITRAESDDPLVQSALSGLTPEALQAQSGAGGVTSSYGRSFTVGQPVSDTVTLDFQSLLGGVFSALGGGQNPLGTVRADPLTGTTVTTYRGPNAAGQRVFDLRSTLNPASVQLTGGPDLPAFGFDFLGGTGTGQVLYRADGLPAAQSQTQNLRLRLNIESPGGERVQMTVRLVQTVTLRPR